MANTQTQPSQPLKQEYQIDVVDHPSVALWMKEMGRKDPEGFLRLIGPNVKTFQEMFGKPQWKNNGEKGWTHGWSVYENSMHWLILTGQQGTMFRLRLPIPGEHYLQDVKVGIGIVQYLQHLFQNVNAQ